MYRALRKADPFGVYTGKHSGNKPPSCPDFFTFACVRNPYSREVSHYLYRKTTAKHQLYPIIKNWSFAEYVAWTTSLETVPPAGRDRTQAEWLRGLPISTLLKFESLAKDWRELLPPYLSKIHINMYNSRLGQADWRQYYTETLANHVYNWAQSDFGQYGYSRDSWKVADHV